MSILSGMRDTLSHLAFERALRVQAGRRAVKASRMASSGRASATKRITSGCC